MYWGRKPLSGLLDAFDGFGSNSVLFDPFCGGGTAAVAALQRGGRVIASDLNPMSIFITRILLQPVSLLMTRNALRHIEKNCGTAILEQYLIKCPSCGRTINYDYLEWNKDDDEDIPVAAKITCPQCGKCRIALSKRERERQREVALAAVPRHWYPRNRIKSLRKSSVTFFHELFSPRNLASLAMLHRAIRAIPERQCRELLLYVFTGMLYSVSKMQMFSTRYESSSRGWSAPRFYVPAHRQEKNVWIAFLKRFKTVSNCKTKLNYLLPTTRITEQEKLFNEWYNTILLQGDYHSIPASLVGKATHVFLDPPYIRDIDYLGFSEFWGSWLQMNFEHEKAWNASGSSGCGESKIADLLTYIQENTTNHCKVVLALGARHKTEQSALLDAASLAGYHANRLVPILWDNTYKRGQWNELDSNNMGYRDFYFVLTPKGRLKRSAKSKNENQHIIPKDQDVSLNMTIRKRLIFYLRAGIILGRASTLKPEKARTLCLPFLPNDLVAYLSRLSLNEIKTAIANMSKNRKAANTLILKVAEVLLRHDGFKIVNANRKILDNTIFLDNKVRATRSYQGAAFVAQKIRGRQKIVFCFEEQESKTLQRLAERIKKKDRYNVICVKICQTQEKLKQQREKNAAICWPGGFLVSFDELVKEARRVDINKLLKITSYSPAEPPVDDSTGVVSEFEAEVIANSPVGNNGTSKHFALRLKSPKLKHIAPGQFIMIDTLPTAFRKHQEELKPTTSWEDLRTKTAGEISPFIPQSFLKRPFGIHRAFYEGFEKGYLKKLRLPPSLALILHTVFPYEFEVFYKTIENGVGTNELKNVKKGSRLRVQGPLGRKIPLNKLRAKGIEEVHLVGGGVGMAPLVYLGQALKYYSFRVKAFIGIDSSDTLLRQDSFGYGLREDSRKAYIYIHDLLLIGLKRKDIYLSYLENGTECKSIFSDHCYNGLVSEQYASYVTRCEDFSRIITFSCGPWDMLKELAELCKKHQFPMKVLLEKRMACGIGVCLSCICRTKKDGIERYECVCTEGPLFDAGEIVWSEQ